MDNYKKILVALALDPNSDRPLVEKAKELSANRDAQLYLIHAVEHLSSYGAAYGVAAGVDVEDMLLEEAKKRMNEIASQLNISSDHQVVKVGPAKFLILEQAKNWGVDLIIVGSHGRHGIQLLLGSTSNAVLHGAKCDVLAVRIKGS
ncbi:universal stress protein [Coxiella burnetii]|uniref:universal stress protein n=1 Tax=Coxiella burnetii TaxID=777 RepID=UPI000183CE22|nr:universal stress protein [Coxiella burnetii]ACJ17484.1 universal stress protein A [Coxiella burnetii CbuG_Q212]ATN65964.1 universal stress protein UspA [Coxiella burnetii]OYK87068.1 universal stress protein A [Coxiella burnetii]